MFELEMTARSLAGLGWAGRWSGGALSTVAQRGSVCRRAGAAEGGEANRWSDTNLHERPSHADSVGIARRACE